MTDDSDDTHIEALCPRCVRDLPAPGRNLCQFCQVIVDAERQPLVMPWPWRCARCHQASEHLDNENVCARCASEEDQ